MKKSFGLVFSACVLSFASSAGAAEDADKLPQASLRAISPATFVANIRTLASDEFEGRGPASAGEAKTIAFLQQQFAAAGLKPGNPNGSYLQHVPLVASLSAPRLSYRIGATTVQLNYPDDYVAFSSRPQANTRIDNSELVFVGYGVVAPEYGWDDYKGVDVRGKTSSCWSTIRRFPTRPTRPSSTRRCSRARR